MQTRKDAFVALARTIDPTDEARVKAACVPEIQWLVDHSGSKLTVQKKIIPTYKQAFRDAGLVRGRYFDDYGEWWLKYFNLDVVDADFMSSYTTAYQQQRTARLQGKRHQITNIGAILAQGMALIDPGMSLSATCAGLALLTGRRESEIGLTARFTPYPDDTVHVDFQGQLKGGVEKRDVIMRIPIFGDRDKVRAALARLRGHAPWHRYTPAQFDASVGSDVRNDAKKYFTPLIPDCEISLSTHALRKVYAASAEYFCDLTGWAPHIYIASIMGHSPDDKTSVESYEYFQVVG
jgi:hypothetical protein